MANNNSSVANGGSNFTTSGATEIAHTVSIRQALVSDLDKLVALENCSFSYDQIGRRSFRYLLHSLSARIWCAELATGTAQPTKQIANSHLQANPQQTDECATLAGYTIVLSRKNSRKWRIYSLATAPEARGKGIAKALMQAVLTNAKTNGYIDSISLEVKCDNAAAITLYRHLGFEVIDVLPEYYSDGSDGYRLQFSWQ